MRSRLIGMLTLTSLVLAACGGTGGSPAAPAASAPATVAPSAATPTASTAASSAPSAALALPADVALASLTGGTTKGTAHFAKAANPAETLLTVKMDEVGTTFDQFVVLVSPGTCADQTEPADFAGAYKKMTVKVGKEAESVATFDLAPVLAGPHAILLTNAPGDHNLACGDIAQ